MEDHEKELQKIVDLYCKATARLLTYLTKRKKELIKSYKEFATLLKENSRTSSNGPWFSTLER